MSSLPPIDASNAAAIDAYMAETAINDQSADAANQKSQIESAGKDRQKLNEEVAKLKAEAKRLQKEAEKAQKEAENTGFFGKLVGQKSARFRDAAEKANKAEHAAADAQEKQVAAAELRKKSEEALKTLQNAMEELEKVLQDVDSNTKTDEANRSGA